MSLQPDLPDAVLDQAITWLVRMGSGTVSEQIRQQCLYWRQADPVHEQAWQALQVNEADFQTLASAPANASLHTLQSMQSSRHSRRQTLKMLSMGLGAAATGLWGWRQPVVGSWSADYATSIGEQRLFVLDDATRLRLNTASAVNVHFSAGRRLIELLHGEIFIDTGSDAHAPGGKRAFWVQTTNVWLQAIGTAFAVRDDNGQIHLRVEQGAVDIHRDGQVIRVEAGEQYLIGASGSHKINSPTLNASAWTQRQLVARQMRLGDLTAELGRYRRGWLNCDAAVADLRISGVFQLDDIDRALDSLGNAVAVRVQRFTPLWTQVVPR